MDVRERAIYYLDIKPRTKYQVKKYLLNKGFSEEKVEHVIEELKEYGYINDLNYSIMYFEYGFEKGRGRYRIEKELSQRGVSEEIIKEAYNASDNKPDEFDIAMTIAEDMVSGIDVKELGYEEKRRLKAKIGRKLLARGFSIEDIYKITDKVL